MTSIARPQLAKYPEEAETVARLVEQSALSVSDRAAIAAEGAKLVRDIRDTGKPGLMEVFLAEYGLSTDEGIALMCLAEALLRVPDAETIDTLIEDKIAPSDWGRHLGHSSSSLVNASTWALMLTGRVLDDHEPGMSRILRSAIKRLGEPVIRAAVRQAMREMGQQFVLGQTMKDALARAAGMEAKGYTYSYDMLGEAARTEADARRYLKAYSDAIAAIAKTGKGSNVRTRPGISVKLSALCACYDEMNRERALSVLTPRLLSLLQSAAQANIGLNIDAEEADRLELSLDVIDAVIADRTLTGWDGFGVVVQAYGPRAGGVLDHLYHLAVRHDRRMMVRLVKGAYWDTEIKRAQVAGMERFPVFTSKAATDVSYIANARKLLGMTDRIYPQFATHNAHTVAAILHMAQDQESFEFQRLHGMGERLHDIVHSRHGTACRIYAPVGAHRDLLAYLVRRLLENGANSSFVNKVVDESVAPETVAADPFAALDGTGRLRSGAELFQPERRNSTGWDLTDRATREEFDAVRSPFRQHVFGHGGTEIRNPAQPTDMVGYVETSTPDKVEAALARARCWDTSPAERTTVLNRAADFYEASAGEIFALLAREAGKTPLDAVGELREAVDFLRYYAARTAECGPAAGVVSCISPWNFPLAIFTGQIAGALSAGCGVLAKPAEQTSLIAELGVREMHRAGVPADVLQLLVGDGPTVGAALTSDARVSAVAFTGSTETARSIRRAMAENLVPGTPIVAETGGLNAMIVDSTALLEQSVTDVVASAFQSAGQRCSALRCLYVQEDIAPAFREMLFGAMDELILGDPWALSTSTGPVIDADARDGILSYLESQTILKQLAVPETGLFVPPTVVAVSGIGELEREIFGPVLHLAEFKAEAIHSVISDINARGYGLTFGLHTRIDSRVQDIVDKVACGNVYVNRNQIGAVVGCQPFGGEGLSGTGPKAGGPAYPLRFAKLGDIGELTIHDMPGPTGETNRLSLSPKSVFLCLGPGEDDAMRQATAVRAKGGRAEIAPDLPPEELTQRIDFAGALWWGDEVRARDYDLALARRDGPLAQLITGVPRRFEVTRERHLCVDTTASGGNADLLAAAGGA